MSNKVSTNVYHVCSKWQCWLDRAVMRYSEKITHLLREKFHVQNVTPLSKYITHHHLEKRGCDTPSGYPKKLGAFYWVNPPKNC